MSRLCVNASSNRLSLYILTCLALLFAAAAFPAGAHAWTFKTIYSFCQRRNCAEGELPSSPLLRDSAGNLFGTTFGGGTYNDGTLFELSPINGAWKLKVLHQFTGGGDGSEPSGPLIMDVQGNLYGTATGGYGLVYELAHHRKGWEVKPLFSRFCVCTAGYEPYAGLTYAGAASGLLYDGASPLFGTTARGGSADHGVAFELTRAASVWRETVLHSFCSDETCSDGTDPNNLILDSRGHLFGEASSADGYGAGAIFELTPRVDASHGGIATAPSNTGTPWNYRKVYGFCALQNCADGANPFGPLTIDADGDFVGTTLYGGLNDEGGTAYRIVPKGTKSREAVLYSFCATDCNDGERPNGGTLDPSGAMYGSTSYGGLHNAGTVFRLKGNHFQVLHTFCAGATCTDGTEPSEPVTVDPEGNVLGTTAGGGSGVYSAGTVFELSP